MSKKIMSVTNLNRKYIIPTTLLIKEDDLNIPPIQRLTIGRLHSSVRSAAVSYGLLNIVDFRWR